MSIDNIIAKAVADAVRELYGVETDPATITPQTTKKEFEGNGFSMGKNRPQSA